MGRGGKRSFLRKGRNLRIGRLMDVSICKCFASSYVGIKGRDIYEKFEGVGVRK